MRRSIKNIPSTLGLWQSRPSAASLLGRHCSKTSQGVLCYLPLSILFGTCCSELMSPTVSPLTKRLCLLMVISVPLAEGSQGWVPLILRDDYFICQNTHRDCLSFPVFKSRSPSQYVITSPVTYNHSLLLTLWLQRHGMKVPRACFWFSSHISEFLLYESTCHVLCLSYCLIPSTPDLGEKYGKLMSVKCGAGVTLSGFLFL